MIIDFHTHIFPDKIASSTIGALASNSGSTAYTDGTVKGMVDALTRANADIAIALPVLTKATQFDSVLNFACSVNEQFKNEKRKIISFAGMHPDCDDIDGKMKKIKSLGIKGIKIHPDYQSTYIDDPRYIEILKCAKKYDLIVVTHSGIDNGYIGQPVRCPVDKVLKVIEEVNYDKFVLAHFGAHKLWNEVLDKLAGKNVYFDTAFTFHEIDKDLFKEIVCKHGSKKVLFATDCPWRDIKDDYEILSSYGLKKECLDNILYKNALKLLNL
ncbi:MAG: metal-dependent hydrolase [Clostridiales bacterium]|nr:metal-dependent hydrolase [Clostridiales bacterium]